MERQFQYRDPRDLNPEDFELLKSLRDKYEKIVFFNGQPEAGPNRLDILPFVDRFFDKSLFSNPENYSKELYGKNLFADYYHTRYGVTDNPEYRFQSAVTPENSKRIELSWNIGIGGYPRRDFPQRLGVTFARGGLPDMGYLFGGCLPKPPPNFSSPKRHIVVHARIDLVSCPSIAYQRTLFLQRIAQNAPHQKISFLTGLTNQDQYYKELSDAKMVLSPFGWGEVCHRDFEAINAGALLLKPDMSHIKTYPDVYIPYETYVPLDWDGNDLFEKAEQYAADDKELSRIAQNAFEQYHKELNRLEDRFEWLLEKI